MNNAPILLALATVGLAAGCSSRTAPTEANFRQVIEPLVKDRFCRPIALTMMSTLPSGSGLDPAFPIIIKAKPDDFAGTGDRNARVALEGAVAQGLLTRRTKTSPARLKDNSGDLSPTALMTYEPTEAGQAIFRAVEAKTYAGTMRAFPNLCLGSGKVDQIVRWTDPADMFGRTITQVTYRYSATDFPKATPPELRGQLTVPKVATVTLMRTNDGWQVAE